MVGHDDNDDNDPDPKEAQAREETDESHASLKRVLALIAKHHKKEEEKDVEAEKPTETPFYRENILSVYDRGQFGKLLTEEAEEEKEDQLRLRKKSKENKSKRSIFSRGYLSEDSNRHLRESQVDKLLLNNEVLPEEFPTEKVEENDDSHSDSTLHQRNRSTLKKSMQEQRSSEMQRESRPTNQGRRRFSSNPRKKSYPLPENKEEMSIVPQITALQMNVEPEPPISWRQQHFDMSQPNIFNVSLLPIAYQTGTAIVPALNKTLFRIGLDRKGLQLINKDGNVIMTAKIIGRDGYILLSENLASPWESVRPDAADEMERVTLTIITHKNQTPKITKSVEIQRPPARARQNIPKEQPKGVLTTTVITTYVDIVMDKDGNIKLFTETPQVVVKNPDTRTQPLIVQVQADAVVEFLSPGKVFPSPSSKLNGDAKHTNKGVTKEVLDKLIENAINSLRSGKYCERA